MLEICQTAQFLLTPVMKIFCCNSLGLSQKYGYFGNVFNNIVVMCVALTSKKTFGKWKVASAPDAFPL